MYSSKINSISKENLMNKRNFISKFIIMVTTTLTLMACGGGSDSSSSTSNMTTSQLVPRGNVNDAKAAYDRITDGMTPDQVMVFMGNPDYFNKGEPGRTIDGSILDIYKWAFADGTNLQLTYKNGRLWWKILGNQNITLVNQKYF
jgi:hypothetical protein